MLNVTLTGRLRIEIADGSAFWMPPVILSGPQPTAYVGTVCGTVRGFYATFEAAGPLALLGVQRYWRGGPVRPPTLASTVRPVLTEAARVYEAELLQAPDFDRRAALSIAFLLDGLARASDRDLAEAEFLQRATAAIQAAEGRVRVATLADELGVSAPTLRRRFAVLGMPVKRFAEVVRFRCAHAFLHAAPATTWREVVDRFGYADQSHFVRTYRRLSGGPPSRWEADERLVDQRMGIQGPRSATQASLATR